MKKNDNILMSKIKNIMEKLHKTKGLPSLEIEGCKYPENEWLLKNYEKTIASIPEKKRIFEVVSFSKEIDEEEQNGGCYMMDLVD